MCWNFLWRYSGFDKPLGNSTVTLWQFTNIYDFRGFLTKGRRRKNSCVPYPSYALSRWILIHFDFTLFLLAKYPSNSRQNFPLTIHASASGSAISHHTSYSLVQPWDVCNITLHTQCYFDSDKVCRSPVFCVWYSKPGHHMLPRIILYKGWHISPYIFISFSFKFYISCLEKYNMTRHNNRYLKDGKNKYCFLKFLKCLTFISRIHEPISGMFVQYLNAFILVVSNMIMKFHNFDIFYKCC